MFASRRLPPGVCLPGFAATASPVAAARVATGWVVVESNEEPHLRSEDEDMEKASEINEKENPASSLIVLDIVKPLGKDNQAKRRRKWFAAMLVCMSIAANIVMAVALLGPSYPTFSTCKCGENAMDTSESGEGGGEYTITKVTDEQHTSYWILDKTSVHWKTDGFVSLDAILAGRGDSKVVDPKVVDCVSGEELWVRGIWHGTKTVCVLECPMSPLHCGRYVQTSPAVPQYEQVQAASPLPDSGEGLAASVSGEGGGAYTITKVTSDDLHHGQHTAYWVLDKTSAHWKTDGFVSLGAIRAGHGDSKVVDPKVVDCVSGEELWVSGEEISGTKTVCVLECPMSPLHCGRYVQTSPAVPQYELVQAASPLPDSGEGLAASVSGEGVGCALFCDARADSRMALTGPAGKSGAVKGLEMLAYDKKFTYDKKLEMLALYDGLSTIVRSESFCTRRNAMSRAFGLASGLAMSVVDAPAFVAETKKVKMGSDSGQLVFVPDEIKICKGDTVSWVNNRGGPHNVVFCTTSDPWCRGRRNHGREGLPKGVDKDDISMDRQLGDGDTYDKKFDTPGTYNYYCEPHVGGGMIATLIVE